MDALAQYAKGLVEGATHGDRLTAIKLLLGRVLGPETAPPPLAPTAEELAKQNDVRITVTYGAAPGVVIGPGTTTT